VGPTRFFETTYPARGSQSLIRLSALNWNRIRVKIQVFCGWVGFRKNPKRMNILFQTQTHHFMA
jgi:hypothetical protein